jgi:predicted RNase H-like nuclease (RuvC/YqgF family)
MNHLLWEPWRLYGLLASGLGLACLAGVVLQVQIHRLRRAARVQGERTRSLESTLAEARLDVQRLETDLRQTQQQTGMLVPPPPLRSGFNLGKRTQVLRMHRAGRDPAAIAAELGVPRGEVELLIKIQGTMLEHLEPAAP